MFAGRGFRKPPPELETQRAWEKHRTYYLQFLRTKLHPVAETVWAPMTAEEFAGLVKSIRAHGQHDPIALVEHEGEWVILDGVCREIACGIVGVEPRYKKIEVDDPCDYWVSVNLMRVHLSRDQKVMADAFLTKPDADEEAYDPDQPPSPIVAARYVLAHSPILAEAVTKGSMPLEQAYELAVHDAWRAQHGPVDLDWLRNNYFQKDT